MTGRSVPCRVRVVSGGRGRVRPYYRPGPRERARRCAARWDGWGRVLARVRTRRCSSAAGADGAATLPLPVVGVGV